MLPPARGRDTYWWRHSSYKTMMSHAAQADSVRWTKNQDTWSITPRFCHQHLSCISRYSSTISTFAPPTAPSLLGVYTPFTRFIRRLGLHVQCESKKSPLTTCSNFSKMGWKFFNQILHAYNAFPSTLDYEFLFNYLQLWRRYAILRATTQRAFRSMEDILSIWWWSRLLWHNFVKVAGNW